MLAGIVKVVNSGNRPTFWIGEVMYIQKFCVKPQDERERDGA